jgi:hypothetical protein
MKGLIIAICLVLACTDLRAQVRSRYYRIFFQSGQVYTTIKMSDTPRSCTVEISLVSSEKPCNLDRSDLPTHIYVLVQSFDSPAEMDDLYARSIDAFIAWVQDDHEPILVRRLQADENPVVAYMSGNTAP